MLLLFAVSCDKRRVPRLEGVAPDQGNRLDRIPPLSEGRAAIGEVDLCDMCTDSLATQVTAPGGVCRQPRDTMAHRHTRREIDISPGRSTHAHDISSLKPTEILILCCCLPDQQMECAVCHSSGAWGDCSRCPLTLTTLSQPCA